MKRSAGGWLMIFGGLAMGLVLWLTPGAAASSHDSEAMARRDFDALVRGISERYQIHANSIPMMWLANVCARTVTHGGVRGMKVVEFEDAGRIADRARARSIGQTGEGTGDPEELGDLVRSRLGERWSRTVRTREADGSQTLVYTQNEGNGTQNDGTQNDGDGRRTRLIVIDLDGKELDMVSMTLDAEQLAKWIDQQNTGVHRRKVSAADTVGE